jgi:hypothetical protein
MDCPDESELDLFVVGKSDGERRAAVEAHLAGCADCRTVVSSLVHAGAVGAATVVDGASASATGARTFATGALVAARYRVVRFIAEGGMGEVYEAEDQMLGASIALKTIRAEIASHPRMLERFRREIVFARKVTHPNVCRIFDVGTHEEAGQRLTFLTMELIPGQTLTAWLGGRALAEDQALPIIDQMAQGLAAAHAERVVHRDFKSHNVMLVERDRGLRVVVTDFGLARGEEAEEGSAASSLGHGLVGSPPYMAPEQVNGLRVDAAADIYALGIVVYEMMTGTVPFIGSTPMLTAIKRLTEDPQPPRALVPELSVAWSDAILRCLRREPSERFASALELVEALREVKAPRPVRRSAWIGAAAIMVGVALVAALGLRPYTKVKSPAPAPPAVVQVKPAVAAVAATPTAVAPRPAAVAPRPASVAPKPPPPVAESVAPAPAAVAPKVRPTRAAKHAQAKDTPEEWKLITSYPR